MRRLFIYFTIIILAGCQGPKRRENSLLQKVLDDSVYTCENFVSSLNFNKIIIDAYATGYWDIDTILIGSFIHRYNSFGSSDIFRPFTIVPNNIEILSEDHYWNSLELHVGYSAFLPYIKIEKNNVYISGKEYIEDGYITRKNIRKIRYNIFSVPVFMENCDERFFCAQNMKFILDNDVSALEVSTIIHMINSNALKYDYMFGRPPNRGCYKNYPINISNITRLTRSIDYPKGPRSYRIWLNHLWIECGIDFDTLILKRSGIAAP